MNKKVQLQEEAYTCGVSCIQMILQENGMDVNEELIKQKSGLTFSGMTLKGMILCLQSFGLDAKGYQTTLDQLVFIHPCILLVENQKMSHFIVLMKVKDGYYYCKDPSSGLIYYTYGELSSIFLNKVVLIEHQQIKKKEKQKQFIHWILQHNSLADSFRWMILGLGMLASEISFSFLFQLLIEKYSTLQLLELLLCLLSGEMIRYYFSHYQLKKLKEWMNIFQCQQSEMMLQQDENFYLYTKKERVVAFMQNMQELPPYILQFNEKCYCGMIEYIGCFLWIYFLDPSIAMNLVGLELLLLLMIGYMHRNMKKVEMKRLQSGQFYFQRFVEKLEHLMPFRVFHLLTMKEEYEQYEYDNQFASKRMIYHQWWLNLYSKLTLVAIVFEGMIKHRKIGMILMVVYLFSSLNQILIDGFELWMQYPKMNHLYQKTEAFKKQKKKNWQEKIEMIQLDDFSFSYGYRPYLLERIHFTFQGHYHLHGTNGSGKSTLLKLLANQYENYQGHLYYNQLEAKQFDYLSLQERIIYLDSEFLLPVETVAELFPLEFLLTIDLRLQTLYSLHLSQLSKGQYQLIVFLYSIFQNFDVYLLDECFNHLDSTYLTMVKDLLEGAFFKEKIVIYCDHALKKVPKTFESVIIEEKKLKGLEND